VLGNFGDLGLADFEVGIQPVDNWPGLEKIETLTHNARTED
jgi:hypothetical protein